MSEITNMEAETPSLNGAGEATLLALLTHWATICVSRVDFDRHCRPLFRVLSFHGENAEVRRLRREARRLFSETKGAPR